MLNYGNLQPENNSTDNLIFPERLSGKWQPENISNIISHILCEQSPVNIYNSTRQMCFQSFSSGCIRAAFTLFCGGVSVGEEPEVSLVVPADQRHAAFHHYSRLAALRRRGAADQHVLWQACTVALPGAQQAATVDI